MKKCFKCGEIKPLNDYYAHPQMGDGHLNKCKVCTRIDTKKRVGIMAATDSMFRFREKLRGIEKYHRLYKGRVRTDTTKKAAVMSGYFERYPEKKSAHKVSGSIKASEGMQKHHWSYSSPHYKDVIFLTATDHAKIHRFLIYDQLHFMYRTVNGLLLATRELHEKYIQMVLKSF